jgi:hypothetical protein
MCLSPVEKQYFPFTRSLFEKLSKRYGFFFGKSVFKSCKSFVFGKSHILEKVVAGVPFVICMAYAVGVDLIVQEVIFGGIQIAFYVDCILFPFRIKSLCLSTTATTATTATTDATTDDTTATTDATTGAAMESYV